jgi:hypothetical protein
VGNLQLCRALGVDVGQHPDVHAGCQPDPGRNELETGGRDGIPGQHDRVGSDAVEFASGSALWDSISSAGARVVRCVGRKYRCGFASAGCLWMVRDPDMDWRGGDQHVGGNSRSGVGTRRARSGDLLSRVLAHQSCGRAEGDRIYSLSSGNQRAGSVGCGSVVAGVGV